MELNVSVLLGCRRGVGVVESGGKDETGLSCSAERAVSHRPWFTTCDRFIIFVLIISSSVSNSDVCYCKNSGFHLLMLP